MVMIDSWVLQSALRASIRRAEELVAAGQGPEFSEVIEYQQWRDALAALEAGESLHIVQS